MTMVIYFNVHNTNSHLGACLLSLLSFLVQVFVFTVVVPSTAEALRHHLRLIGWLAFLSKQFLGIYK